MTVRFKNKCFIKDTRSYLQQALDWSIFLVQSIFLKKKIKIIDCFQYHNSIVETAVNSYTYLLIYFEVQCIGYSASNLHSTPAEDTYIFSH